MGERAGRGLVMPEHSLFGPGQYQRFARLNVPHVDEYFGLWAALPDRFQAVVDHANRTDLAAHVAERRSRVYHDDASHDDDDDGGRGRYGYELPARRVALISIEGPLPKYGSSLASGTSTAVTRRRVRNAARDEGVGALLLVIDSPGGTANGIDDLAEEIAKASASKPCYAYIEDTGASGAYWLASQASKVFANRAALVGSIGAYMTLVDSSGEAEKQGLKVHVIKAGDFKGIRPPGTPVHEAQIAE